jgi:DNA-binding GntR family transcriptional regulator
VTEHAAIIDAVERRDTQAVGLLSEHIQVLTDSSIVFGRELVRRRH